ncbi:TPA: DNA-protecting protein DprA [Streptococcus agalactiae]|jgi:DNA protecting protein DprA|uniref:DNA protecting protein DprA n=3 Tax=Streptococcus agalactiae TaxID=1311 RepID=A0AAW3HVA8_STRAG|nr:MULTISPECIES: DNA-processing protein DprA [Streptococcus]EPX01570.1 DNA polymerase sliding clamp subunit [Streptococcus agalactiae MRI Z1-049]HEO8208769.1 DNA-protecting protein DprA [Streptococcus agalactiae ADL-350]AAM99889.1 DprA/SMF protein, putative DNA processing factor [Streptococcus agalactiae 2603V/R]AKU03557.1 DNA protecting protein DprA [Streptococcus agalactiae]AQY26398.1 DNA processing protein DprA [Streptococcus agalactiae]
MNHFELFKLKKAGLTNLNIHNIINYLKKNSLTSLSVRNMAVVSKCKNPTFFIENYKQLDLKKLRQEFKKFPVLSILDSNYPLELKEIYNPPVLLFYQGNIELLSKPKLAVVGARQASQIGCQSVKKIIKETNNQFVIVSGLARGIDTAAHVSALKNGGSSIAVIGSGLDVYYPTENKKLQEYMSYNHLVLSEYFTGEQPLKFHFPERNRIIAGLCQGIVVAEAKMRSGSLITCERALEEGREVFAIPGNIIDGKSDGCHHLIQEGAKCIISGKDILSEYQ